MDDVIVRLLDLPYTVHGFTSMDSDRNYNVYINSKLSKEMQYRAYKHEIERITERHWDYKVDVNEVEKNGCRQERMNVR